eukprot:scaffold34621_cov166-Amphora_coffeaeformis.AAC.21
MQIPPTFEIRVALIGYVSVGKTTVLNALFGGKYGEVAMKRTTAVVNNFRIATTEQLAEARRPMNPDDDDDKDYEMSKKKERATAWATTVDEPKTAARTFAETIADNVAHRNSDTVIVKTHDVVLDEELHKMRKDTKLVVVDIPGINEAGTSSKYKDYVNENWHTFDVAVVVMDGRQGVNTEEQIDDPYDEDQQVLVDEFRASTESIFKVTNRSKALDVLLGGGEKKDRVKKEEANQTPMFTFCSSQKRDGPNHTSAPKPHPSPPFGSSQNRDGTTKTPIFAPGRPKKKDRANQTPAFTFATLSPKVSEALLPAVVPVSATHAFLYRCGSRMTFESFCKMDVAFINKLGKESYGRQWHRYSQEEKMTKAFEAVHDEEQRRDGVAISNFDAFLKVLDYCIGDDKKQTNILQKQIEVFTERFSKASDKCDLGVEFGKLYDAIGILGGEKDKLTEDFWVSYSSRMGKTFRQFIVDEKGVDPTCLAYAPEQLESYTKQIVHLGLHEELEKIVEKATALVEHYCATIVQSVQQGSMISGLDLLIVLRSMLLGFRYPDCSARFERIQIGLELLCSQHSSSNYGASIGSIIYGDYVCEKCKQTLVLTGSRDTIPWYHCNRCNTKWIHVISWATRLDSFHCKVAEGSNPWIHDCIDGIEVLKCSACKQCCWHVGKNGPWFDRQTYSAGSKASKYLETSNIHDPSHFGYVVMRCLVLITLATTRIEEIKKASEDSE